jgi:hypothetical protein
MVALLRLVENERQVSASHQTFVSGLDRSRERALDLARRTHYWVYDPVARTFSPSKFVGYVGMSFDRYETASEGVNEGVKFDGGVTQRAIAQVLGEYEHDVELASELKSWVESRLGRGALDGIASDKWKFVRLPTAGVGGLAQLAGGWEGSEELIESLESARRDGGRAAPDLE